MIPNEEVRKNEAITTIHGLEGMFALFLVANLLGFKEKELDSSYSRYLRTTSQMPLTA